MSYHLGSSPLAPPIMRHGSSFSSTSSSSSSVHRFSQGHRFSSPDEDEDMETGHAGTGGEEDEELASDVERSFGEAMSVGGDDSPFGSTPINGSKGTNNLSSGQEYPFPHPTFAVSLPSQDPYPPVSPKQNPPTRRQPSATSAARPVGMSAQAFEGMMMLASPDSSNEDGQWGMELSPTAQRRTGSGTVRRPGLAPIQRSSEGLGDRWGASFGMRMSENIAETEAENSGTLGPGRKSSLAVPPSLLTQQRSNSNASFASTSSSSSSGSGLVFATSRSRTFGRESSRPNIHPTTSTSTLFSNKNSMKGLMLPPPVPAVPGALAKGSAKKRMGLPSQWGAGGVNENHSTEGSSREGKKMAGGGGRMLFGSSSTDMERGDSEPVFSSEPMSMLAGSPRERRRRKDSNSMDVDSPFRHNNKSFAALPTTSRDTFDSPSSSSKLMASSLGGSPDLGSFFCDSPSAPLGGKSMMGGGLARMKGMEGGKLTPTSQQSSPASPLDSPSSLRPQPAVSRIMEKSVSTNAGGLFGGSRIGSRRTQPYKRPMLGPLASCPTIGDQPRVVSTASAFPVMEGGIGEGYIQPHQPRGGLAMRRAFSVCDQGGSASGSGSDPLEEGDEVDNSPLGNARVVSHYETGSSGPSAAVGSAFRALGRPGAISAASDRSASPFSQGGILGFGENEMDGKILPCHRVKDDGLVRITHNTLRNLINGEFEDQMKRYHIIDCRFDYEYKGGHIEGAINARNEQMVEELLLNIGSGIYGDGELLPQPSKSGDCGEDKPVVIVFHCEFSIQRAPKLAKHLRSRDRTMNNQHYPKVFYPELYILEGGYSDFFSNCPDKCEPQAYKRMDDVAHAESLDMHEHHFRSFNRTKSFTYGEKHSLRPQLPSSSLSFAAASAAADRRGTGHIIHEEDDTHMASPKPHTASHAESPDSPDDGSPCARAFGGGALAPPIFGSTKNRILGRPTGRAAFMRVASYAGTTERR